MGWPGPMTHRQYEAWQAWLDIQWNRPSLTDHYLMALIREVRGLFKKGVRVDDCKLKFEFKQSQPATPDPSGNPTRPVPRDAWSDRQGSPGYNRLSPYFEDEVTGEQPFRVPEIREPEEEGSIPPWVTEEPLRNYLVEKFGPPPAKLTAEKIAEIKAKQSKARWAKRIQPPPPPPPGGSPQ